MQGIVKQVARSKNNPLNVFIKLKNGAVWGITCDNTVMARGYVNHLNERCKAGHPVRLSCFKKLK